MVLGHCCTAATAAPLNSGTPAQIVFEFPLDSRELFGYDSVRMDDLLVQGRRIGSGKLGWICELMALHPQWGRSQLSIHIAQRWNWRNVLGQLKDMAARWLLLNLERRGLLRLFPRQRPGRANHKARRIALEPEFARRTQKLSVDRT